MPYGDKNEVAKDRLIEVAEDVFASTYVARRWPVAFVGSGLSLVYGGVSWDEAVDSILEDAFRALVDVEDPPAITRVRIDRLRAMLRATIERPEGERLETNDKYVALELAEDAFSLVRAMERHDPGLSLRRSGRPRSANEAFAALARDDGVSVSRLMTQRRADLPIPPGETPDARRKRKDEEDLALVVHLTEASRGGESDGVQDLAASLYTLSRLKRHVPTSLAARVDAVARRLADQEGLMEDEPLPVDRRSLTAPFIGAMSTGARKAFFDDAAAAAASAVPRPGARVPRRPLIDPLRRLRELLGVNRFLTLNYDFELENLLMVNDLREQQGRTYGVGDAISDGLIAEEKLPADSLASGRSANLGGLTRRMPDGNYVASDLYRPGAAARLFEFGLNSPDHSAHIVHLHGRADYPSDMVARDDDYNRFYRRTGHGRESLERALDVTLLGNPILFIGTGLSEAEITRAFRQLVSDGRITRQNPAFALMPLTKHGLVGWREQLGRFQLHGLHVLHYGHPRRGEAGSLPMHIAELKRARDLAAAISKGATTAPAGALPTSESLGLIRSMPGDAEVWDWIAPALTAPPSDRCGQLGIEEAALPRFMDGVTDFLGKLEQKLYAVALDGEIGHLAAEIETLVGVVNRRLDARAIPADGPRDWMRHGWCEAIRDETSERLLAAARAVEAALAAPTPNGRTIIVEGAASTGKGALCRMLQKRSSGTRQTLTINIAFGIEIDSTILQIAAFLRRLCPAGAPEAEGADDDQLHAVSACLRRPDLEPALILLTGVERLFNAAGKPICADFRQLLAVLVRSRDCPVDLVIFAGERSSGELDGGTAVPAAGPGGASAPTAGSTTPVRLGEADWSCGLHRRMLDTIEGWREAAKDVRALAGVSEEIAARLQRIKREGGLRDSPEDGLAEGRRTVQALMALTTDYLPYLRSTDQDFRRDDAGAAVDFAVLRTLGLIGAPVERRVLRHAPALREVVRRLGVADIDVAVEDSIAQLERLNFVQRIRNVPDCTGVDSRLVLHRAVLRFMRDRMSVPFGDSTLANSFSLTLASSLPTDTMVPDSDVHAELTTLLGHLRSSWKDVELPTEFVDLRTAVESAVAVRAAGRSGGHAAGELDADNQEVFRILRDIERLALILKAPTSATLRAAANLVRSFFSAASLVSFDPYEDDRTSSLQFEAHKRRIQEIFTRARELQGAPERISELLAGLGTAVTIPGPVVSKVMNAVAALVAAKTAEPLYDAETTWLHNERGVIASLQGDLYEAEFSLGQARATNTYLKAHAAERPVHSLARIELNRAFLMIERGRLDGGQARLGEVRAMLLRGGERERELLAPIVESHQGLIHQLMGRPDSALACYEIAQRQLNATDQLRALSQMLIGRSSLQRSLQRVEESAADARRAIFAAEAGRQFDLLWRARLVTRPTQAGEVVAMEMMSRRALDYAQATGVIRVEVEALLALVHVAEQRQNWEQAMQYATQAMIAATRGGMTLRKINLRVIMGRLMLRAGDTNGEYLLRRAVAHAERVGYQAAVESAQQALSGALP